MEYNIKVNKEELFKLLFIITKEIEYTEDNINFYLENNLLENESLHLNRNGLYILQKLESNIKNTYVKGEKNVKRKSN